MRYSQRLIRMPVVRLYGGLLHLYPPRFRAEFLAEIRDIFLNVMLEADERGGFGLIKTSLRELSALVISIFRECGHELRSRKEKAMAPEEHDPDLAGLPGGGGHLQTAGAPNWTWVVRWTLLTTAAIPAAYIAMAPLAALFLWLIGLGDKAGLWPAIQGDILTGVGFVAALALGMAAIQWYLLRSLLPRAGWWFAATGGGFILGGLVAGVGYFTITPFTNTLDWGWAAMLITVGLVLGLLQWSYLRRFVPKAVWIIAIDGLAASSPLLSGQSFTTLTELVVILLLPGLITGVGLWLLLRQLKPSSVRQESMEGMKERGRRFPRLAWVGLGLVALVPLYFLFIYVYATSQLALAKNNGVYPTVGDAIRAYNSQGWGGAQVVRLENVHASPNSRDGSQPHVWFGGATIYLDRAPEGLDRTHISTGSYYIHVREGWVLVSEGAFPEFIGWVMELYGLEGVQR